MEEKIWIEIPLSKVCKVIFDENLGGCDRRVMLLYKKEDYFCMWGLIEGKIYEWCELLAICLTKDTFPFATVNNKRLIIIIEREMNMSILNKEGILMA